MRPSPRSSGEGRFRASLAAILALRRAYSSSRCSVQNPSIHSSTGSIVARMALGMRNASACLVPGLLARFAGHVEPPVGCRGSGGSTSMLTENHTNGIRFSPIPGTPATSRKFHSAWSGWSCSRAWMLA